MSSQTFLNQGQCVNRKPAKPSIFAYAIGLIKNALIKLERNENERQSRLEIQGLLKLSHCELYDMGITKDDVRYALNRPLEVNAGEMLDHKRSASSMGK